ncbi:MAG TPA: hypothetical protein VEI97_13160, partial [bacterium]|nr:hypothetical protein [bacterium]
MLDEGIKSVAIIFRDEVGETAAWAVTVQSGPYDPNVTWADLSRSKRTYGLNMLPYFSQYRRFLELADASGNLEGTFASQIEYDLAVARRVEQVLTEALIVHPDLSQW